jgi:glycosyltransferase involved in cell wall biosynthesis
MASFLRDMRSTGRMQLWSYFPIDSHNREGKLGHQLAHTLTHYDRRLVPSEWARKIVERTLPNHSCEAIPHGIDTSIFYPHTRNESRDQFGLRVAPVMKWPTTAIDIPDDALWIGVVATNQNRKDWGLAVEVVHEMKKSRPVVLWAHTDAIKREWSILELLSDFGLLASSIATVGNVSDEVMAQSYSAMDITLGIGRGEGFGYPIAESLACGVPCISGSYGAQSDFLPRSMQVDPQLLRIENDLNLVRPLYGIEDWVRTIESLLPTDSCEQSLLPMDLDWVNLWPRFAQWFKDGVK